MKLSAATFYALLAGLFAIAIRDVLFGYEENGCSMTYMFEYPEYQRIRLPKRLQRQYPSYGLYLYGEGIYAEENKKLKLTGIPVLFLPGNAGSYKQARSLGSVALRKAENMDSRFHLNVFTVNFNEELVALYGGSLQRQTKFIHECIRAILKLYKDQAAPPSSVAVVGHSMGGIVARALFTLPKFNHRLISLIITQATPHQGPVLPLDSDLLDFYATVNQHWSERAQELRNVTVLSVGGGFRDYQVRSGLTALPCPSDDPNKLSLVSTAVPRTWVSTDHLSIVWCKELVLATVRTFFDLVDPDTKQITEDPEKRMAVIRHHFVRHPVKIYDDTEDNVITFSVPLEVWTKVLAPRLSYTSPKEPRTKYCMFPLSSHRKSYSHFHCQSSNLEMSSWLFGCTQSNGPACLQAVDLSWKTELLPAFKVLTLKLDDYPSFSHIVVSASNTNAKQFSIDCEFFNEDSRIVSTPVTHVLSFGVTVSEVVLHPTGLIHNIQLQDFHQIYQAFTVRIESHCQTPQEGKHSVYRLRVPWFREDSFTTARYSSGSSVTQISARLHSRRPDNTSTASLQLHTSPGCRYTVTIRTSVFQVLGQILRFHGSCLPVYIAVSILLAYEGQLHSLLTTGHTVELGKALSASAKPYRVMPVINILLYLLSVGWLQAGWSALSLPPLDVPPLSEEGGDWSPLVSLLLFMFGSAIAYWGSALLGLSLSLLSIPLSAIHRPSTSPSSGRLGSRGQISLMVFLVVICWTTCGALALIITYLIYLYKVLRLQMSERILKHVLNLAPRQSSGRAAGPGVCVKEGGGEAVEALGPEGSAVSCNGSDLVSVSVLEDTSEDLYLHLTLLTLLTLPVLLSAPSFIYWTKNLRYSLHLDPDPCWPVAIVLVISAVLLMSSSTASIRTSKLLKTSARLQFPVSIAMVAFALLHLYRVAHFIALTLSLHALSCLI
ncbi:GPI inositol-deacylase isoform X1 [Acipenser ruthenus]|uniref:GPI inositol-deacylase isoform X1 n=1 Tax=Acipenser ruthenus TaxID=7906 RepID=UPI002741C790|nr:GPI inositol-deacylase isoform X1 [Acipenser ruthenus]